MADDVKDFRTLFRELRGTTTVDDVWFAAKQKLGDEASSLSLVQKALAPGSKKRPSAKVLRTMAMGLGVEPDRFYEYRLAVARDALDETVVGPDRALEQLRILDAALLEQAVSTPRTRPASEPGQGERPPSGATRRGPRRRAGG